jgi:hypothetical protein
MKVNPVATDKPKLTAYVSQEIKTELQRRADNESRSESAELEEIIKIHLNPHNVVIQIRPETRQLLEAWANEEVRTVEGLIEWLVEKSAKERTNT